MSVSSSTQEAIVIAPFTREAQTMGGVRAQATSRLQPKPSSNSNSGSQRAEGVGMSAQELPSSLPSPTSSSSTSPAVSPRREGIGGVDGGIGAVTST